MFQFHNGSIKSAAMLQPEIRGNSFNSTMVRLKATQDAGVHPRRREFQFHNGSIKRIAKELLPR